jgi:hypothetical protein
VATQGDSLCCFHAFMYYNPNWFNSTSLLHSSLVHFPWWPGQFKISIFIPVWRAHQPHSSFWSTIFSYPPLLNNFNGFNETHYSIFKHAYILQSYSTPFTLSSPPSHWFLFPKSPARPVITEHLILLL